MRPFSIRRSWIGGRVVGVMFVKLRMGMYSIRGVRCMQLDRFYLE